MPIHIFISGASWFWPTLSAWLRKEVLHNMLHAYLGLARAIYIDGVYTVFLAGISPRIRSYTVNIYGSGQPCAYLMKCAKVV